MRVRAAVAAALVLLTAVLLVLALTGTELIRGYALGLILGISLISGVLGWFWLLERQER